MSTSALAAAQAAPSAPVPAIAARTRDWPWLLLLAGLITLFLSPALLPGRYLSPAALLVLHPPWHDHAPPGAASAVLNGTLWDPLTQFEPWLGYTAHQLRQGRLPLWNPDNGLGAPFLANMQTAVFYPPNWLAFLWPDPAVLVWRAWLKLFLAASGTYLLARQALRVPPLAALVAALAFACGAFMITLLDWPQTAVAAWLPWLWWATARLVAQPTPRRLAGLAGCVALSLLAGHPETSYTLALATGLWLVFLLMTQARGWRARGARLGFWVAAYGLGAALAAIQLLPFLEYLSQSSTLVARQADTTPPYATALRYAWTLFSPDLYGNPTHRIPWDPTPRAYYAETNIYPGVLVLLLAALAGWAGPHQRRIAGFLLLLGAGAAAIAYRLPGVPAAAHLVPFLDLVPPNRLLLFVGWALALLAGLGTATLQQALAAPRPRLYGPLLGAGGLLLLGGIAFPWLAALSFFQVLPVPAEPQALWRASLLRAAGLILLGSGLLVTILALAPWRRGAGRLLVLIPVLLFADLLAARGDYNPTVSPAAYFPPTPALRFLQAVPGPTRLFATGWILPPDTNMAYGLTDLRSYDALEPYLYRDLTNQIEPSGRAKVWLTYFTSAESPLLNLLGVRYVLTTAPVEQAPERADGNTRFVPVLHDGDVILYENRQALPRAWLVHHARTVPDPAAQLAQLNDPAFDARGTALLSTPWPASEPLEPPPAAAPDQVTITTYAPEDVTIVTQSAAPGLLLLSDLAFPGWQAWLDGQPVPIYTADHALRAVYVPAGTHTVRYAYQPLSVLLGGAISGITLLGLVVGAGRRPRKGAPAPPSKAPPARGPGGLSARIPYRRAGTAGQARS